jgi:hypothetical protein
MRASELRARRTAGANNKLSRLKLDLGTVAGRFFSAVVDNKAREICVYGPRGEAKTQTLLLAAVAHAEQNQKRGFPTPVKWIGVTDTHRAHVVKTVPSLFDPLWSGGWKVYDGDHLAVFSSGGKPLVAIELFGVEDQGAIDRLRMETVGVWFEEPVAVAVLDQKGISETAWMTAISSQRLPAYSHPAVITTNYPDEDHWTVARFHPPLAAPPYIFQDGERMAIRIPRGDNPHLSERFRDEMAASLKNRPDLFVRLSEGNFGSLAMGSQVAAGFNPAAHVAREVLLPIAGEPLLLGQDFGHTPATIIGQSWRGFARVYAALTCEHGGVRQHFEASVIPWLSKYAPWALKDRAMITGVYDPAGNTEDESDTDQSPIRTIEKMLGGYWMEGGVSWESRKGPMLALFNRAIAGEAALRLCPAGAAPLIKALKGRWYYPLDKLGGVVRDIPKKPNHPWEDLGDAFCYFASGLSQAEIRPGPIKVESDFNLFRPLNVEF